MEHSGKNSLCVLQMPLISIAYEWDKVNRPLTALAFKYKMGKSWKKKKKMYGIITTVRSSFKV